MDGASHCASVAPVWHTHGWTCGPEKIGPPIGWLTIAVSVEAPSASAAVTVFDPLTRPVNSPSNWPFGR